MLVLAASAGSEQGAFGGGAFGARPNDFQQVALGEIFSVAENPRPHPLSAEGKRHHYNPAVHPPDARAEVRDVVDFKLDDLVVCEGFGDEVARGFTHWFEIFVAHSAKLSWLFFNDAAVWGKFVKAQWKNLYRAGRIRA